MTDDIEKLLQQFHPANPPMRLRETILFHAAMRSPRRRWLLPFFRSAIAALFLLSFTLLYAADRLNRDSADRIGIGPPRWTPEAQQAADLLGPGPQARRYIAICLIAGNNHRPSGETP